MHLAIPLGDIFAARLLSHELTRSDVLEEFMWTSSCHFKRPRWGTVRADNVESNAVKALTISGGFGRKQRKR